jgi:hypothetical protein
VGSKKENRVKNIEKRFLLAKVWEQKENHLCIRD